MAPSRPCERRRPVTCVIAIDAGTTGVRALAVDAAGAVIDVAYRELTQYFPRPAGWSTTPPRSGAVVRHHVSSCPAAPRGRAGDRGRHRHHQPARDGGGLGPLNRRALAPGHRVAGPADRAALRCAAPSRTPRRGAPSAPAWCSTPTSRPPRWRGSSTKAASRPGPDLVLGTVDSWVIWNLTGGPDGGELVTDPTNAGRTLLYDIREGRWSEELADIFGVPLGALPDVRPSCGRIGVVAGRPGRALVDGGAGGGALAGVPVSGVAGDQQAALFGQACFTPGMAKVTYGTGSFVLANVGPQCPEPVDGLLTTVAWDLGSHGGDAPLAYALEGAVFVTGAAIQWLRDGLGIITEAAEIGPLAESVPDTEGVVVVPAFTGLGSPWWDPYQRGTIVGHRGTGAPTSPGPWWRPSPSRSATWSTP